MRHRKKKGRLNRKTASRKAMLKHLANALFTYQRIETTLAKAKALRSFAEPLITLAKKNPNSVTARRRVVSRLSDKTVVKTLFDTVSPLYLDVPGGYTRIMPLGARKGDGTQMAIIELTKKTISDAKLLKIETIKEPAAKSKKLKKSKKSVKEEVTAEADIPQKKKKHSAPEVDIEEQEKRIVENVRKQKARTEQTKVDKKGIFKRFRRKSLG
ncbi:MAG: 50S ribosomal protein L17 [Candidatus Omnitrophota bacterium]|nr:50S ribosomal protein L17 [Candidatus Omnitrophota bacterium]MBU1894424.1 50S ribosomal protein L17 [Candidatus Omnitrophota bacterium]